MAERPPYLLISDLHCHNFSAFSCIQINGVNSRLQIMLDEICRAAEELRKLGGKHIYVAGDWLHTRGSMDPEVFNPVFDLFKELSDDVFIIRGIPGNHDLKGRDTSKLGNAMQSLDTIEGVQIVTNRTGALFRDDGVLMLPWHATKDQLRATIKEITDAWQESAVSETDLIIHVGIDGMLDGVPDTGLSAKEVASWGFKRVFAGDYHNHRVAEDGKVISIGATTHQQWGDIDSKAGFLLVWDDRIEYRASHAPSFIELTADTPVDDYPLVVDGNYVRIRGMKLTDAEITALRAELIEMGARGVSFQVTREAVTARGTTAVAKATTLDQSIDAFVDQMKIEDPDMLPAIKTGAADILNTVRSVSA